MSIKIWTLTTSIKRINIWNRAEEMSQQLRTLTALVEDPGCILSTHIGQFTTTCHWLQRHLIPPVSTNTCTHVCISTQRHNTDTQTHTVKNKSLKKYKLTEFFVVISWVKISMGQGTARFMLWSQITSKSWQHGSAKVCLCVCCAPIWLFSRGLCSPKSL